MRWHKILTKYEFILASRIIQMRFETKRKTLLWIELATKKRAKFNFLLT